MQNKTALVVDDSRVARMTLAKLLKAQDFAVVEQDSGEAALDWLQSIATKPDIVFMDVTMGGIDGLTACHQIKSQQILETIPVVICTGNDSEAGLDKALASGAAAVLSKPPAADALQALLDDVAVTIEAAHTETPSEPSPVASPTNNHIDDIMAAIRQQLMPELQQQIQTITTDLSRDIARQTAQEASDKHGLSLVPEITRQVTESAQQQVNDIKQSVKTEAEEIITSTADQAIAKALQNYGLTEKLMATLRSEGMDWLNKQQEPVRDALLKQLQHDLMAMVSRCLEQQLSEQVLPLVKSQLVDTQQELENSQQEKLTQLQAKLKQQQYMSMAAIALAGVAFLLALL